MFCVPVYRWVGEWVPTPEVAAGAAWGELELVAFRVNAWSRVARCVVWDGQSRAHPIG